MYPSPQRRWFRQPGSSSRKQIQPVLHWPIPSALLDAPSTVYRNDFATALSELDPDDIVRRYVYLSVAEMERLVRLAEKYVLDTPFAGSGIELGAGCGLLSAVVARRRQVNSMFAVEICQRMAERVIPRVAHHVLGDQIDKITPVVGSFDDIQLDDQSLDFAIELDSFHHSNDLKATISECSRVLKPGGFLLCFDRCHPNTVTDEQVEQMLAMVYSPQFLRFNHYPADIVLTRRDNGEHEYRMFEWEAAFEEAGLRLVRKCEFVKRIRPVKAVKGLLSVLPQSIRKMVYQTEDATLQTTKSWVLQRLGLYRNGTTGFWMLAPKQTTAFLLTKAERKSL